MTELKKLPLRNFHAANNAKFAPFAGWEMPVSYGSALEEHLGVRQHARAFDVSHMGEIDVSGPDALKFLNGLLTNDLSKCEIGCAQYTFMCNEQGGVIDDLIVYRLAEDGYFLCVNASNITKDYDHLTERKKGLNCQVLDLSNSFGLLAIQGPASAALLANSLEIETTGISKMRFSQPLLFGEKTILARTGYTGEDGFEIYCSNSIVERLAESFQSSGINWAGLAARDSLRLEAGFPLHGHEISEKITPIQARLGWAVGWNKPSFLGDKMLRYEKEHGSEGYVGYYEAIGRRIPRAGAIILDSEGTESGRVLSGGYSPSCSRPIGTAWIREEAWVNRLTEGWKVLLRDQEISIKFGPPVLKQIRDKTERGL